MIRVKGGYPGPLDDGSSIVVVAARIEPPAAGMLTLRSTPELRTQQSSGGLGGNRTPVGGFAVHSVATPPPDHVRNIGDSNGTRTRSSGVTGQ